MQTLRRLLIPLGILLLVFGLPIMMLGREEMLLVQRSSPQPQEMDLKTLIERGPGDNIHVRLTNFTLLLEESVVEEKNKTVQKAYLPAVPANEPASGPGPRPSIHAIVTTSKPRTFEDVERFCAETTRLEGLVVSDVHRVP